MFKPLVFVTLLLPSLVNISPKEANNNNFVTGAYNFRYSFDFSDYDSSMFVDDYIYFDNRGESRHKVQASFNNYLCYIDYIYFYWDNRDNLNVSIEYYYSYNDPSTIEEVSTTLYNGDSLDDSYDLWTRDFIFYLPESYFLSNSLFEVFNRVFTHDDNTYVTSYTGYYNSTGSINQKFTTIGSQLYDNRLLMHMNNTNNIQLALYSEVGFTYYDLTYSSYEIAVYSTPVKNVYFQNVKMSNATFNILNTYGNFGYLPNSDPSTFKDLIFSVMDAPIYFLSSLLSFELFGVNMFIAFTGLLTLACILLLIRKVI